MNVSKPAIGSVYWVKDCEPPEWKPKDRYVVVAVSEDGAECLVVPFSTSSTDADGLDVPIKVPPRTMNKTGLTRDCSAVVGGSFRIRAEVLSDKRGHLSSKIMESILAKLASI